MEENRRIGKRVIFSVITPVQTKSLPEFNEVVFFEVFIMTEAGNYEGALRHLAEADPHICDVLCLAETKGMQAVWYLH